MNKKATEGKRVHPPKILVYVLERIILPQDRESLPGDFEEMYHYVADESGVIRAFCWYLFQIIKLIPSFITNSILWSIIMFKNYLTIAFRNIKKYKGYSFINIAGLAIGMACFILMVLYVINEFSFDRFHAKYNRICRVIRKYEGLWGHSESLIGGTPAPLAPTIVKEFTEVVNGTRVGDVAGTFRLKNQSFNEKGIFADEHFFEIFSFEFVTGQKKTALTAPFSMIITETLAKKYFDTENPIGKILNFSKQLNLQRSGSKNENYDVTITGVIKDVPQNSHIQFDYILSFITLSSTPGNKNLLEQWRRSPYYNYIELMPGAQYADLHERLAEYSPRFRGTDSGKYILQPLGDIHWEAKLLDEMPGNIVNARKYLYLFSTIAFIILIIACINYMNLATARFARRTKEIGLRKIVGARKAQLIRQFIGESISLSVISFLGAILLVMLLLPYFNSFIGSSIQFNWFENPLAVLFLLGMVLLVGVVAGSYPALFLAALRPVNILKGNIEKTTRGSGFRKALVVFQFSISICLIAGTLVVSKQLDYVRTKDVGYDREHVVVIPLRDVQARQNTNVIIQELVRNPSIEKVSGSDYVPLEINNVHYVKYIDDAGEEKSVDVFTSSIGYDFFEVYKLQLVKGRHFSPEFVTDEKSAVILNETAVQLTGWSEPVGKVIDDFGNQVIGVVKDFHQSSLHEKIDPMVFFLRPADCTFLSARIAPGDIPGTIQILKNTIEKFSPNFDFEYYFQDDYFNNKYKADERFGRAFRYGSALAIFIACLGVFGLASFSTERRTKEIAIRKILGASVHNIARNISKEFLISVTIANIFAWPAAWFVMNKWLQNFAYRISIDIWAFVLSAIVALVVALFTVGFQAIKAACANPVDSLKCE